MLAKWLNIFYEIEKYRGELLAKSLKTNVGNKLFTFMEIESIYMFNILYNYIEIGHFTLLK